MAIDRLAESEMRRTFGAVRRAREAVQEIEAQQIVEMLAFDLLQEINDVLSRAQFARVPQY